MFSFWFTPFLHSDWAIICVTIVVSFNHHSHLSLIVDPVLSLSLQRGFEQQWLSLTFSKAIFLGNGLVAIVSGLFGNLLVDTVGLGPVSPFDAAACFLAIGMAIILSSWTENYGDPSENKDLLTQFKGAAIAIASGKYYC